MKGCCLAFLLLTFLGQAQAEDAGSFQPGVLAVPDLPGLGGKGWMLAPRFSQSYLFGSSSYFKFGESGSLGWKWFVIQKDPVKWINPLDPRADLEKFHQQKPRGRLKLFSTHGLTVTGAPKFSFKRGLEFAGRLWFDW